uniref:Uncharacterized protein n=1 Tax=Cannabis sativa TaxID=3483 RepID=A0A803Q7G8_CANSA
MEMENGTKHPKEGLQSEAMVEPKDISQKKYGVELEDNADQTNVLEGFRQAGLEGYQLARDRARRGINPSARFAKANLIAFALAAV